MSKESDRERACMANVLLRYGYSFQLTIMPIVLYHPVPSRANNQTHSICLRILERRNRRQGNRQNADILIKPVPRTFTTEAGHNLASLFQPGLVARGLSTTEQSPAMKVSTAYSNSMIGACHENNARVEGFILLHLMHSPLHVLT